MFLNGAVKKRRSTQFSRRVSPRSQYDGDVFHVDVALSRRARTARDQDAPGRRERRSFRRGVLRQRRQRLQLRPSLLLRLQRSSPRSGNIAPKVDEYRALLGDPKNGGSVAGPAASGRREVNWDGVNGANLNSNTFPGDFFAVTTKLGLLQ